FQTGNNTVPPRGWQAAIALLKDALPYFSRVSAAAGALPAAELIRNRLLFEGRRPAQTAGNGWIVVLALNRQSWTALVEAEHFVRQFQPGDKRRESPAETEAALGIHLGVCVEVLIAVGTLLSQGGTVGKVVAEDVGGVVGDAHPHG